MPQYKSARPRDAITLEDVERYMIGSADPWVKALIVCLWVYGIRISEALSRTRRDFTVQQGYLWLNAPPMKNPNEPDRRLPISLETPYLEYLTEYLTNIDPKANPNQRVWSFSTVWAWVQLKRVDSTLCAHRFRHNRATKIALTRAHPYELQSWLGHSDIRMASTYIHASGIFAEDLGRRLKIT
jgi:integrase